jgi:thioredoxin 1
MSGPWRRPDARVARRSSQSGHEFRAERAAAQAERSNPQGDTMAGDNVQTFTDGNFDETVMKSGAPVLVDFWAEWCGPCKRLAPTVDALAAEYAGKVTVGKLNVDDNPNTATKFQIRGIPTLLIFKGGQVVESVVGLAPKDDLKKAIDKHL